MQKLALVLFASVLAIGAVSVATPAEAYRGGVRVVVGGCCGYYPPGWSYYGYPSYYYVAPPPVAYLPPPAYAPAPVATYAPPAAYAPYPGDAPMPANQASPTFTNERGQTCREYQSSANVAGAKQQTYGTACLQPDGSWRIVQ